MQRGRAVINMARRFIDIGANLTDLMYAGVYNGKKKHDADVEQVLRRSWDAGLSKIIITGGSLEDSQKALELAKLDERLYITVGCHPTRCSEFEKYEKGPEGYLEDLKAFIEHSGDKIVAIGECGLDYDRLEFCDKETQKKYLKVQLELCKSLNFPLFLHCRAAAQDLLEILLNYQLKGVVHSFDGTLEEAKSFIDLGYFIGLNGCSLKTADNLKVIKELSGDRIMLETDCPWCEIKQSHAGYKMISQENLSMVKKKKEKWEAGCMVKDRNEPLNISGLLGNLITKLTKEFMHEGSSDIRFFLLNSNTRQVLDVIASIRNDNPDELCQAIHNTTLQLFFPKQTTKL